MLKYFCRNKILLNTNKVLPIFNTYNKFTKFSFVSKEEKLEAAKSNPSNQNSIEQEKESWNQFLDFMLKREQYTWNDYLQQINYSNEKEKGIWRRLRSRNDDEKEEVLITKKFVSSLFADEITKENFDIKEIKDIIQITELSEEIITPMIFNFRYYKGVHQYLMNKKRQNEELPKTQNEMQENFIEDTPKFIEEIQKTMFRDIKKRLNYSDNYIEKMERKKQEERFKKYKRTHKY